MRTTILEFQKLKKTGQRIPVITAYDATGARLAEAAGASVILVGDSLGMVVQGNETTIPVTLDDMIYHTRSVLRGTKRALIIFDMPFMTYTVSLEQALSNAARAIQESGAGAIKLEGGTTMAPTVARIVSCGIPVMGHIGMTPQSFYQMGGFRAQGKTIDAARRLMEDALALEAAGAFSIVLETMPRSVAQWITERLHIPTIGIGAGPHCDGQVQVFHDLIGLIEDFAPRHSKRYAEVGSAIRAAISAYLDDVRNGMFPTEAHSIELDEATLAELRQLA